MSGPEEGRKEYGNPTFVLQQEQTSITRASRPRRGLRRAQTQSYRWGGWKGRLEVLFLWQTTSLFIGRALYAAVRCRWVNIQQLEADFCD